VGPSGIWKPAACELPISITTTVGGPYDDTFDRQAGTLRYAYRGLDPQHRDNRGLRRAMVERVPIVYFHAIERGSYVAAYPVFVVEDHPAQLRFSMQVDDLYAAEHELAGSGAIGEDAAEPRRAYVTATFRRRRRDEVANRAPVVREGRACPARHVIDLVAVERLDEERAVPFVRRDRVEHPLAIARYGGPGDAFELRVVLERDRLRRGRLRANRQRRHRAGQDEEETEATGAAGRHHEHSRLVDVQGNRRRIARVPGVVGHF